MRKSYGTNRVWFYRPDLYWDGWKTFNPFMYGHDEFARRTLCIGWGFTGQIVLAVWECNEAETCWGEMEAIRGEDDFHEDADYEYA